MTFKTGWVALFGAAAMLGACGGGDDTKAREKQIEATAKKYGVDADVRLDKKGEVASVEIKNGMGATVGNNLKLPADFPNDVKLDPDWAVMAISPAPQGGYMVQAMSDDSMDETLEAARKALTAKGWTAKTTAQPSPMMTQAGFEKGERMTNLNLIQNGDKVAVQLLTMKRP